MNINLSHDEDKIEIIGMYGDIEAYVLHADGSFPLEIIIRLKRKKKGSNQIVFDGVRIESALKLVQ